MGYSERDDVVRVDFFRESGKWYATEAVKFPENVWNYDPISATKLAIKWQLKDRYLGMFAVCLEPHVNCSYPAHVKDWESFDERDALDMSPPKPVDYRELFEGD